jgi:hypothetical protein
VLVKATGVEPGGFDAEPIIWPRWLGVATECGGWIRRERRRCGMGRHRRSSVGVTDDAPRSDRRGDLRPGGVIPDGRSLGNDGFAEGGRIAPRTATYRQALDPRGAVVRLDEVDGHPAVRNEE